MDEHIDEQKYQEIRARLVELFKANPEAREVYVGSEALQCYERGLIRQYGIVKVGDLSPEEASWHEVKERSGLVKRLLLSPELGDWDIALA